MCGGRQQQDVGVLVLHIRSFTGAVWFLPRHLASQGQLGTASRHNMLQNAGPCLAPGPAACQHQHLVG